jgi:hypothetical protein
MTLMSITTWRLHDDYLQDNEKAVFHYRRYLDLSPDAPDRGMVSEWMEEAKGDLDWQRKTR